jgi:hypothetical protein
MSGVMIFAAVARRVIGMAAGLALALLAEGTLAAPTEGTTTIRGFYDTLLNTMKKAGRSAMPGDLRNSIRSYTRPSTSQR